MDALLADLISGDDTRSESAMYKLAALGAKAIPALLDIYASSDADHRWWAISTLAQMENIEVDWLLTALDDTSVEVQQSAVLGLTAHPHPKVVSVLLGILQHSDSVLRSLAMNALIALGKDATPGLLNFLDGHKEQDAARLHAVRALASIGDTKAIPALMAALEEESALIRHWAEGGLEKLGLDMVYMKLE